jgi:hypothetical protein
MTVRQRRSEGGLMGTLEGWFRPRRALHGDTVRRTESLRERRAARKRARLVSPRNRRSLALSLRKIAVRANAGDPMNHRHSVLLRRRAAAATSELLETADELERTLQPSPAAMTLIDGLLTSCDSPLYNPHVPAAELSQTLSRVRFLLVMSQ